MNILHIDTGKTWRGGQQQILFLAEGLKQRGHEQLFFVPNESPLARTLRNNAFLLEPFSREGLWQLRAVSHLRELCSARSFDILHAHDSHGHDLAVWSNAHRHASLIVSRRVTFTSSAPLYFRWKFKRADRVLAVSEFIATQLMQRGIDGEKIEVVHDCVSFVEQDARVDPAQARSALQIPHDAFVVGTIGALTDEKGHADLIRAVSQLTNEFLPLQCIILGEGPKQNELWSLARQLRIEDRVRIITAPSRTREVLPAFDLFVLPSRSEGFGSILLLVMLARIPVVATRVGGIPEIVEDQRTGFLYDAGNVQQLVKLLRLLERDPVLRRSVLNAAEQCVRDHFSVERMTIQTERAYERARRATHTR